MEPLIKQLDDVKADLGAKEAALWAAENALQCSAGDKLGMMEEVERYKITAAKGNAQNEALRRSLLDELDAGGKYKDRMKALEDDAELQRQNVRKVRETETERPSSRSPGSFAIQ